MSTWEAFALNGIWVAGCSLSLAAAGYSHYQARARGDAALDALRRVPGSPAVWLGLLVASAGLLIVLDTIVARSLAAACLLVFAWRTARVTGLAHRRTRPRVSARAAVIFLGSLAVGLVVMLLVAPALADTLNQRRVDRARADAERLADAVQEFARDNGLYPVWRLAREAAPGGGTPVDVLLGPGAAPDTAAYPEWGSPQLSWLVNQIVRNRSAYAPPVAGRPGGWRGPYILRALGPDPWGNRYVINAAVLPRPGEPGDAGRFAVWALSAGPNRIIETPFRQPAATAALGGDDVGARIR